MTKIEDTIHKKKTNRMPFSIMSYFQKEITGRVQKKSRLHGFEPEEGFEFRPVLRKAQYFYKAISCGENSDAWR